MDAVARGAALIGGDAYFMWIPSGPVLIRGRRLFDARHLLDEIQY